MMGQKKSCSVKSWIKSISLGLWAVSCTMLRDQQLHFILFLLEQETQMKPELQSGKIYIIYTRELE